MDVSDDLRAARQTLSRRFLDPAPTTRGVVPPMAARSMAATASIANVHALGIGREEGVTTGPATTVRVYVTTKLPLSLLSAALAVPDQIDGVPVQVIQAPPAFLASCSALRQQRQRPMVAGISAGHARVTAGTLGAWCRSRRPDEADLLLALSNNHVFANVNDAEAGDAILQPGALDGGHPVNDVFAYLHRHVPIRLGQHTENLVDAAIARLVDPAVATLQQCTLGTIDGTLEEVDEGARVRKHGRTTGATDGVVQDVEYEALVGMDHTNANVVARFVNQLRVVTSGAPFVLGGDSGSLVVTDEEPRRAVGLLFAGPADGSYGLVNPITAVLDALDITLA